MQSTAKGWPGTVPSQGSPRVSAYPTSFLWQSQVGGPRAKAALASNVSAENNKTVWTGRFPPLLSAPNTPAPPVDPETSSSTGSPRITSTYDFMTGKTLLLAHLCPPLARAQSSKIFPPFYSRDTFAVFKQSCLEQRAGCQVVTNTGGTSLSFL